MQIFVTKIGCMGHHEDSIYTAIRRGIIEKGEGNIFFLSDFSEYSPDAVRQVMSRMVKEGYLLRLSSGIFLYPKRTRFGVLYPTTEELVKAVSRRDSARVIPTGYSAANMLGISDQVPMREVYLTDGTARVLRIGDREIRLKRAAPRNFAYKSETLPLVVSALKTMGVGEITPSQLAIIEDVLKKEGHPDLYREDLRLVPQNIRKIVSPIIDKIENELATA